MGPSQLSRLPPNQLIPSCRRRPVSTTKTIRLHPVATAAACATSSCIKFFSVKPRKRLIFAWELSAAAAKNLAPMRDTHPPKTKSFLVLFCKKELLAFPATLIPLRERRRRGLVLPALRVEVAVLLQPQVPVDGAAFHQFAVRPDIDGTAAVQHHDQVAIN